ncbi:Gfo/Idh/MocA family protein [Alteribacillus sp. HJP-4]|uniref:Gfo/Idh/MocA family protein n=1 Tax=Alteribacillus sp. HJP-4 TaxID=2775394 RepID=UPI0035CCD6FE
MLKAAVIGVNNIGRLHCQHYSNHPDIQLVSVCDLLEERAAGIAEQFNTAYYTDVHEMLEKEDIDLVSVTTAGEENGSHHFAPTVAAIEAGKDVMVEKPLSNNVEEARKMVEKAKARNVRLGCNLNHSFVPAARKGKEMIEKGDLGTLLFINMKLTIQNPKDVSPWFHMRALHPHSIDVMRNFGGEVKRVQSFMIKAPGRQIWSTVSINMEFCSGAVGHLTGSYDMSRRHPIEYCEAAGDQGRFVIDNVYENFTFYPHERSEQTVLRNSIMTGLGSFHETIGRRLDRFIQQVKEGAVPEEIEGSGADALAGLEVIEAAIQSQKSNGRVIDVRSCALH